MVQFEGGVAAILSSEMETGQTGIVVSAIKNSASPDLIGSAVIKTCDGMLVSIGNYNSGGTYSGLYGVQLCDFVLRRI